MSVLPEYIQVANTEVSGSQKGFILELDTRDEKLRLTINSFMDVGLYLKFGCYKKEDEQILYKETKSNRIGSFAGGKEYYPDEIKDIKISSISWNLTLFFESRKAEGYEVERRRTSWKGVSGSFYSTQVRFTIKNSELRYAVFPSGYSVSLRSEEDLFIIGLTESQYQIYHDSFHEIFYINVE